MLGPLTVVLSQTHALGHTPTPDHGAPDAATPPPLRALRAVSGRMSASCFAIARRRSASVGHADVPDYGLGGKVTLPDPPRKLM